MNKFTFTAIVSLLCLAPAAAYSEEPQNGDCSEPLLTAQSNPWDKYSEGSETETPAAEARPAGKSAEASGTDAAPAKTAPAPHKSGETAEGSANPWDRYEDEPENGNTKPAAAKNGRPGKAAGKKSAPASPAAAEGAPSVDETLPAATGNNPWDKYQPAQAPASASSESRKKNSAKVKERPAKLELAQPLPVPEMPSGKRMIKNVLPVGTDNYFAIEYDGQLVGCSKFRINRMLTLGGQSTYVMESASRIKLGIDKVQDLHFQASTQVDKATLAPSLFVCAQKSSENSKPLTLNCIRSKGFIAQNNNYTGKEQNYLQKFDDGDVPLLVFNNLWGHLDTFPEHYWLLVRAAAAGGVLDTYDPILQGVGRTVVYAPIKETWKDHSGKSYTTLVYKITDVNSAPLAYVRLYANNYELAEIREIGTGFTFRRSVPAVEKTVASSSGCRIKANAELSNIYFQNPDQLAHMEAFLDLNLRGGELAQHEVRGYKQQFYGDLKEGHMNGRAVVTSTVSGQEPAAKFPLPDEVPEDIQKYLKACPGIELEVGALKTKAMELTWKSESAFRAAQRINGYVANQISEGAALPSARQTLESQVGNPEGKALLLTALLRSVKIPARVVGGLAYRNGMFAAHYWTEAWLGAEDGWVPFDPASGEAGFVNASHITLWESGDLQAMDVVVEKYSPRPPRTVDYFKTPLKWPIGEKRTYSIYQGGSLIGLESASVYDMEVDTSGENYNFKSESLLMRDGSPIIFNSTLKLNPQGLPVSFDVTEDNGKNVTNSEFKFKGSEILENLSRKTVKSLPRPAKSQALIEREKAEAEKAASEETAPAEAENNAAPAPEEVSLNEGSAKTAEAAEPAKTAKAAEAGTAADTNAAKAQAEEQTKPANEAKDGDSAKADEALGKNMAEAAQGGKEGENAGNADGSVTPEEAISDADREAAAAEAEAAEAAARKEAKAKADAAARAALLEAKACRDEAEAKAKEAEAAGDGSKKEARQDQAEPKYRRIPYSIGTYLIDQRFLSQWALVVEQSPAISGESDKTAGSAAPEKTEQPAVDPNTGRPNVSEEIRPDAQKSEDIAEPGAKKDDDKDAKDGKETKDEAAVKNGETGAGTFGKTPDDSLDDESSDTYSFKAFIPGELKVQDLSIQRAETDETITLPDGTEVETARLDTEQGMVFYADLKTGKILKISVPAQELEVFLESSRFEI